MTAVAIEEILAWAFRKSLVDKMIAIAQKYHPEAQCQPKLPAGSGFVYGDFKIRKYCANDRVALAHCWRAVLGAFEVWIGDGLMDYLDVRVLGVEVSVRPQSTNLLIVVKAGVWYKDPFEEYEKRCPRGVPRG
jgi:hypothetical protein